MNYAAADGVPNQFGETLTVFNIGGNKYRLVARIAFAGSSPDYPVYPQTPARGELAKGRSISSPHSCVSPHFLQSTPLSV